MSVYVLFFWEIHDCFLMDFLQLYQNPQSPQSLAERAGVADWLPSPSCESGLSLWLNEASGMTFDGYNGMLGSELRGIGKEVTLCLFNGMGLLAVVDDWAES